MSTATRVGGQGLSPIRRMALGAPEGTISLGLGEPGWPLPAVGRRALAEVGGADGALPYGPNGGTPELVDAVGAFAGAGSPEQVMVTAGSQAALFALFSAHVEPGSAVLVPDPGFLTYPALARLCGAEPVGYPLGPGGDLDAEAVVEALTGAPHTSLVVLNHPANPTGGVASAQALATVVQACRRQGAVVVSDEVYRELWVHERPASVGDVAGAGDGCVVLGSMSKAFGAPGLRVGWAVGDPAVLEPARVVHNAMTTAAARPSQAAAVALLGAAEEVLADTRRHVARRWETARRVAPGLVGRAGDVGFYLWLPVPERVEPEETEAFALRVREESRVTTIPGSAFGPRGTGFLRVGLGGPLDELEEGLRRLAPWWEA